jgi:CelD/BcsL family acetyltransferase involved in cellulose biosynthesis
LFQLRVARDVAEIERLGSSWDSLITRELTLFQSHRWNRLAANIFVKREEPYFIFAENDNGVAILPAVIQQQSRTISFAGECLFDYRDYLAAGDSAPLSAAWQKLASLNLPMSITAVVRSHDRVWRHLPKHFFTRAPRLYQSELTSEQFVRRHPRAFSRLRKLERMGLRISQYSGDSPIVSEIYRLRRVQSTASGLFHDPLRGEFMVAVCGVEGSKCEVFALEHGSTLAAALVTFRDAGWRRCYTIFYDYRWARFSPGVSLLFEVARRSLEQGINLDLMTGDQPYKKRVAPGTQELFKVSASASDMHQLFSPPAADFAA